MTAGAKSLVRIATRASRLALWQARHVEGLICHADPRVATELIEVLTVGDRDRTEPLSQMGGLGVFTREVQFAVLDGRADIAVHSLKDLPTDTTRGLTLAGVPQRGPRFDALLLPLANAPSVSSLDDLPAGARVGTGSLRRQAQLLNRRQDLVMREIRGNVETRVSKLDEGAYDAIILAQAGLDRLGL
jgi:hydroxymethylbilane synthase